MTAQRVGSFRFYAAQQRWEWSPTVERMHGYEPGTVNPTTDLVMSHKHPEDAAGVAALIDNVVKHGQPFSSRHRIIDTHGNEHQVIVVADRLVDDNGDFLGTAGFYIDITDTLEREVRTVLDNTIAGIAEHRAVIEQAKGVLMLAYAVPAETAFDILVWRSQQTNVKLRDLAAQFLTDVIHGVQAPDTFRTQVDHLFLTAHERIGQAAT
ncbi:ANTAR domain-containing protein [Skermania sp. ID1734]|uniref:PAS and ANTAR domain-containing protein n=1 Tax=Skermania sp. ID1734 TaxID=2597516 RepID=UPI00117E73E0|nr:PAS and ANTAR domain-containing protein [Skermania sp. ID1734]TSD99496.1 ANTAR domain-containing protein [Skermania sp. ID1734]